MSEEAGYIYDAARFNPNNIPDENLPIIYGFNNGQYGNDAQGVLVTEDGEIVGSHICSHEGFMLGDLGIIEGSAPHRHEVFKKIYPDGYRMEFVSLNRVPDHPGLQAALTNKEE